jgi:hypothetical protein
MARLLGLSYPDEWGAFLSNNPPELVQIIVEALSDENVLKLILMRFI